MNSTFTTAFILSFLAGAATAVGGALSFVIKKENLSALSIGLGFSAGVMLYVSFMEILPHAQQALSALYGTYTGQCLSIVLFFSGTGLACLIDQLLPSHHVEEHTLDPADKLKRLGLFTAFALAIHNFPEGLATFLAAMDNTTLGVSIAVAVAIHNIPEGIAVALPVFHATGKRRKAFWYSAFSGLAEPVGAVIGYFCLRSILHESALGVMFALIAGIMVYISLDELLPTAHDYGNGHQVIGGIIGGMAVMAISLLIF